MKIRLVTATRLSTQAFMASAATGRSLTHLVDDEVELRLFPENRTGLPAVYNQAITEARQSPAILVFAHDDLLLLDHFWPQRLREALTHFDVVGLAGNRRRLPRQPGWAFIDDRFTWDDRCNLSGVVGHGTGFPPRNLSVFGPSRQEVKLLDGLLMAASSEVLIDHALSFDERFNFHFYDMDFCREAEKRGLRCGTWDLALVHESAGNFGGESWRKGYSLYLDKWGE